MIPFVLHLVIFFAVIALLIGGVLYFNYQTRTRAKALLLSELAIIRANEARTEAELDAKLNELLKGSDDSRK